MKRLFGCLGMACALSLPAWITPANAADHVLVMAISAYPSQPLVGVKHDVQNALALAGKLGYDTRQALVFKDEQLTLAGIKRALAELKQRVRRNDRVFILYSGHGTSLLRDGQCVQALVPIDVTPRGENLLSMADLNRALDDIKSLTSDAMVVIDACHSGGLREIATRGGSAARLRAKAWVPAAGEACSMPINVTKQWGERGIATRGGARPESNFVFIAAANEREVALDDPDKGGLASGSLKECVSEGVEDSDGSQGISVNELAACAQRKINAQVGKINQIVGNRFKPHRIEVYGNAARNLAVAAVAAPPATTGATSADRASQTLAMFEQVVAGSNGNWALDVAPSAREVRFGEKVGFSYTSSQAGHASVLYVGSDRKDIAALLVNRPVVAGTAVSLGRTTISEPAGENHFLVIFSQVPLELDTILRDGKAALTAQTLRQIQCATATGAYRNASKFEGDDSCPPHRNAAKTLIVEPAPDIAGYAARALTVTGN